MFRNKTQEWQHIFANGEEIICTAEHPFFVLNTSADRQIVSFDGAIELPKQKGQWIAAKDLQIFDKLLLSNGKECIIENIEIEHLSTPETTYNFEVEDFHNYFVTKKGILVHNACETKLYRAMSDAEYGSFTKHGRFSTRNAAMAEKWMATTYDDAVAWGSRMMGKGNFRVVEIRVPTSSLSGMNYANYALDGIGNAYSAHYKHLNEVMIGFRRLL